MVCQFFVRGESFRCGALDFFGWSPEKIPTISSLSNALTLISSNAWIFQRIKKLSDPKRRIREINIADCPTNSPFFCWQVFMFVIIDRVSAIQKWNIKCLRTAYRTQFFHFMCGYKLVLFALYQKLGVHYRKYVL